MTIRPLYDRIVVRRIKEQESMSGSIVIPDSAKEKPQEADVITVGPGKRLEDGKFAAPDSVTLDGTPNSIPGPGVPRQISLSQGASGDTGF